MKNAVTLGEPVASDAQTRTHRPVLHAVRTGNVVEFFETPPSFIPALGQWIADGERLFDMRRRDTEAFLRLALVEGQPVKVRLFYEVARNR